MILRIDGDLIVYRCGFGGENNGASPNLGHCLHNVKTTLRAIVIKASEWFEVEEVYVYLSFSSKSNFRNAIAVTQGYKANRKDARRPVFFEEIREYMVRNYYTEVAKDEEADDLMGIHQSRDPENSIIVSWDKDMKMIPGFHYNYIKDRVFYSYDPGYLFLGERDLDGYGIKWFYAQMLLGDRADNIPGIKGYGPASVYRALKNKNTEQELFDKVWEIYYNKGHDQEYFKEQAQLLWIRRKEEEIWEPKYEFKVEEKDDN